jgi:serine protease Do
VITKINNDSPLKNTTLAVNDIIIEAQKKKIKSINDLEKVVKKVLNSNQKTILLAIYNNQNQRRYLGAKLK